MKKPRKIECSRAFSVRNNANTIAKKLGYERFDNPSSSDKGIGLPRTDYGAWRIPEIKNSRIHLYVRSSITERRKELAEEFLKEMREYIINRREGAEATDPVFELYMRTPSTVKSRALQEKGWPAIIRSTEIDTKYSEQYGYTKLINPHRKDGNWLSKSRNVVCLYAMKEKFRKELLDEFLKENLLSEK